MSPTITSGPVVPWQGVCALESGVNAKAQATTASNPHARFDAFVMSDQPLISMVRGASYGEKNGSPRRGRGPLSRDRILSRALELGQSPQRVFSCGWARVHPDAPERAIDRPRPSSVRTKRATTGVGRRTWSNGELLHAADSRS